MVRTYKNLWTELVSFENLLLAAQRAQKGKRFKENTARFNLNLEKELFRIQEELVSKRYVPGRYKEFVIHEPVRRTISAAPYRDRVVHHALCNVIEPLFERSFIYDSYANRKGKGTHRALDRFQAYMNRYKYVLKCDIKKYFPSIDHEILYEMLKRRIADREVLRLIGQIIDGSNPQEPVSDYFKGDNLFTPGGRRKGLPIGNLTSQFFANVYLNGLDHFVKEELKFRGYLRYVDDFALFGNSKEHLWEARNEVANYLEAVRLRLHPRKTRVFPVKSGCDFLGFLVYPHLRRVKPGNVKYFERRMKVLQMAYGTGKITLQEVQRSVQGWIGHARYGNSFRLREKIFSKYGFSRA